jgi:hypothetical protein
MKGIFVNSKGFAHCDVDDVVVSLNDNVAVVKVTVDGESLSIAPANVQSVESVLDYNVTPTFPTLFVSKGDYRTLAMRTGSRQRKPRAKK